MSSDSTETIAQLERAYQLQKRAREEADQLLEEKSRELYMKNESLKQAMAQLNQQQAQLITQEKLASVGQLGASLAHELNNPNAFIRNNLVALEDYINQLANGLDQSFELIHSLSEKISDPQTQQATNDQIKSIRKISDIDYIREDLPALMQETLNGSKRITAIANSLRYFANPDVSTRKSLDINECIHQAQTLVHNKDQLAAITFQLDDLPLTQGLPMLLSQALANIIQNAIEAQHDKPKVTIRSYQQEQNIVIEVQDFGEGIEDHLIEEIFKPFRSTKPGQNGPGLGIAQHIIEQHEGTISIESTPDNGTCVRISLPLTSAS